MGTKKYKLTEETINVIGKTLYRIEALKSFSNVRKGDKGGFIENEKNLSHNDDCWVYDNAEVFGEAKIRDKAMVYDNAIVYGNAEVYDSAKVYGNEKIGGNTVVCD